MADLLMIARDSENENASDAEKYFAGDPIVINESGSDWGTEEDKAPNNGGMFFILTITDKTAAEVQYLNDPAMLFDGETQIYKHAYKLVVTDLPLEDQEQIMATGRHSATWDEIKGFIVNKQTGIRES